jgi:hypothetical protein
MSSKVKKVAIGASVVLGSLGIGGAGFALVGAGTASAATTSSTGTAKPDATKGQDLRTFLRRHTVDATVTVKTKKGLETISLVRGTVGAISTGSITVDPMGGSPLTASITDQTKFHNTTDAQLATGDKVGVLVYDGVARWVNTPKAVTQGASS